jgi:hypothetical protein
MTHTHEYDCIVCGAHFDNGDDLDRHNHAEHIRNAVGMEVPRDPSHKRDDDRSRDEESPR